MILKFFLAVLILLNAVVLMGQVWPEGAPPFAVSVNIITLVLNVLYFTFFLLFKKRKAKQ